MRIEATALERERRGKAVTGKGIECNEPILPVLMKLPLPCLLFTELGHSSMHEDDRDTTSKGLGARGMRAWDKGTVLSMLREAGMVASGALPMAFTFPCR